MGTCKPVDTTHYTWEAITTEKLLRDAPEFNRQWSGDDVCKHSLLNLCTCTDEAVICQSTIRQVEYISD